MSVSYPNQYRNYCVFNPMITSKTKSLDEIKLSLEQAKTEEEVLEDMYILNLKLDEGEQGIDELYPALSKYNQTKSPNIQTYLAGIYRKTKVPDAFGPLWVMLIQNAINPPKDCGFDPNEEIGGAILNYLA